MSGFLVTIPVPVSVNQMYGYRRRGRYIKPEYATWIEAAGWELRRQRPRPIAGPYKVLISLPKIRGDADNRCKGVLDLLVKHGLTPDDRHCRHVSATIIPDLEPGYAVVSVEPVARAA